MSLQEPFQSNLEQLKPDNEFTDTLDNKIDEIRDIIATCDDFDIAKIWKSTAINPNTDVGKHNAVDIILLVHTTVSERKLYEMLHSCLESKLRSQPAHPGVKVKYKGLSFHIIPTKFAAQGTIEIEDVKYPHFTDIVGLPPQFTDTSRILQKWQFDQDYNLHKSGLTAFEIEIILAHIFSEEQPIEQSEILKNFFEFVSSNRLAGQFNIDDRHGNIIIQHDFKIPNKQLFIDSAERSLMKLKEGNSLLTFSDTGL